MMPLWLQHLLVITTVALCVGFTAYQAWQSLNGKQSKVGSCCAKGCSSQQAAQQGGQKIHFLPSNLLRKRR